MSNKTRPSALPTTDNNLPNPPKIWSWKHNEFLRTAVTWGIGLASLVLVVNYIIFQTPEADSWLAQVVPFVMVIFGAGYMVKFIGRSPALYCGIAGFTVGMALALVQMIGRLLNRANYETVIVFLLIGLIQGLALAAVGALAGYVRTRGRTPIVIEMPTKKEIQAAQAAGESEPAPRIVTPIAAMPGSKETNASLLKQLKDDPGSLLPEKDREKYVQASTPKTPPKPRKR